jgi:hypothetical protein
MKLFSTTNSQVADLNQRKQVREARVAFARANDAWVELEQTQLVKRGPSWLIDVESDRIFVKRPGVAFQPGTAKLEFVPPNSALWFYVDAESGELVLLERLVTPRTWSEALAGMVAK